MSKLPSGKYQLKSLHEEISLLDRKLAHTQTYETFATVAERTAAEDKLSARRNLLIRKAQQMIEEGIEFSEAERPRSLRPVPEPAAPPAPAVETQMVAQPIPSPYANTALDYHADLEAYKANKSKRKIA